MYQQCSKTIHLLLERLSVVHNTSSLCPQSVSISLNILTRDFSFFPRCCYLYRHHCRPLHLFSSTYYQTRPIGNFSLLAIANILSVLTLLIRGLLSRLSYHGKYFISLLHLLTNLQCSRLLCFHPVQRLLQTYIPIQ